MKLNNRLKSIANLISKDSYIADIGTDHGYLVAYLIENKIIKKAIASDINIGPVENCKSTINELNFSDFVDIRLGGGFLPYKINEVDCAVIAGMGGQLIRDIIIESRDIVNSIDTLILQPMTGQGVLRKWLINNNFIIEKEIIVSEADRYYEIIVVKHGKSIVLLNKDIKKIINFSENDDLFLEIGYKIDLKESNYSDFLDKKISKYEMILNQIKSNKKSKEISLNKMDEAIMKIQKLKEVKNAYKY